MANTTGIPEVEGADRAIEVSIAAATIPATGVHKPAISRMPASAPILCWTAKPQTGVARRHAKSQ